MLENQSICLLNDSFPPLIDGVANTVVNYANILHDNGHPVVVATPRYPGSIEEYPYPVIRYRSLNTTKLVGYRAGYPFSMSALSKIQKENVGLIHSHCPIMSTLLARTLREIINVPIVFTYHSKFDVDFAQALKFGWIEKAAIKVLVNNISACDEVWVVSQGAGENLRGLGYEGDYRVMHNGVDFPKRRADKQQIEAVSLAHHLQADVPVFLFVGRIKWYKGLKLILDALGILKQHQFHCRMIFVGDGDELDEVKQYAARIGVMSSCIFTGAIRDREQLRAYFSRANLFLFPSAYDTNGIVVREAAACALGSVLLRGSCAAEDVQDGRNGIFIDETAQSLAQALLSIGGNFDAMAALGQRAQDEIYIAWQDSVQTAWSRYQVVLDQYQGKHRKSNSVFDYDVELLFRAVAQVYEGMDRMRRTKTSIQRHTRTLGAQVAEKLDRHKPEQQ